MPDARASRRPTKKTRYKLHWASGNGPSPLLKWEIWDWSLRVPVVHLENRALGRQICKLLNAAASPLAAAER